VSRPTGKSLLLSVCCLIGVSSVGCGSDGGPASSGNHAGAPGGAGAGPSTGSSGGMSGGGDLPGGAGAGAGSGGQGGAGPSASAHVQFVLREVH
jgi:hypothetical protein